MNDINISLDGNVGGAIQAVREIIEPEQRRLAKQNRQLVNAQLRAAINKQNAETLKEEASATVEQAESERKLAEASKLLSEANLLDAQASKFQAETNQILLDMAIQVVEFTSPKDIDPMEKLRVTIQTLELLKRGNLTSEKITLGDGIT